MTHFDCVLLDTFDLELFNLLLFDFLITYYLTIVDEIMGPELEVLMDVWDEKVIEMNVGVGIRFFEAKKYF